jgi:very-short-patch-repair endonuclease
MEARGFSVLRFWNIEVFENLEGVLAGTTLSDQTRERDWK